MSTWQTLRDAAPEIVAVGEERLRRFRLAMLGTIRADGSPRISTVEPVLGSGQLLLGLIRGSAKAGDLGRDPRCSLHSIVDDPDAGDPELTLRGRFVEVDQATRQADPAAWWLAYEESSPLVGTIELDAASVVRFDLERGELSVMSWTPASGVSEQRKPYP
jgi:pyridoxamine 5'-phosphate oxidase-like protein